MLIGTVLGVLIIPSLYIIFQTMHDKFAKSGIVNISDDPINKNSNEQK
jgi:HAE1 family hydrophobic/amphiphilic exporter-1